MLIHCGGSDSTVSESPFDLLFGRLFDIVYTCSRSRSTPEDDSESETPPLIPSFSDHNSDHFDEMNQTSKQRRRRTSFVAF